MSPPPTPSTTSVFLPSEFIPFVPLRVSSVKLATTSEEILDNKSCGVIYEYPA